MAKDIKNVLPTGFHFEKNLKEYDWDHITTSNYMQVSPVAIREVIPHMDLAIDHLTYVRMNPLVKPAFGRARVNNRAFFVPYRTIMPKFAQFIESEPIFSLTDNQYGLQTSVPVIENSAIIGMIIGDATSGTSTDYDVCVNNGGTPVYYKLGPLGHYRMRVFLGLGYRWLWTLSYPTGQDPTYSALPLLAFTKVMIDWYYPSQYLNGSLIAAVEPYLNSDSLTARVVPPSVVGYALQICQAASYGDNVFTMAWDRPVAPNSGLESPVTIHDTTMPYNLTTEFGDPIVGIGATNVSGNQTPVGEIQVDQGGGTISKTYGTITQYQHMMLQALTDMTQRHRLSGVRAIDRYLSEYGVNLSSEIMRRSILLGSQSIDLDFYDVMSNSDTSGAQLGQYAGKGLGCGKHMFEYNIGDEFGLVLILQSIVPDARLYQGINKIALHKSIMDFYHGDYDGKGVRAIRKAEVYLPDYNYGDLSFATPAYFQGVFGFGPSDYELKSAPSVVSGAFALNGNSEYKAFTLMRDLSNIFAADTDVVHDVDFVLGNDRGQYNRIFYNDGGTKHNYVENFIIINHFEAVQEDYTAPLTEVYKFEKAVKDVAISQQVAKVN